MNESNSNEEIVRKSFVLGDTSYYNTISLQNCILMSIDLKMQKFFISKEVEKLLGISQEDFIKNPRLVIKSIHPSDQFLFDEVKNELMSGKPCQHTFRVITSTGEIRQFEIHGTPVFNEKGVIERIFGMMVDITEIKHEQNFIQYLTDEVNIIVWSANLLTKETIYSPSVEKIYGIPPGEFNKNPKLWLEVVHPDDILIPNEKDKQLLSGEKIFTEYRIIRPSDGEIRWIEDRAIPNFGVDGRVIGFYGMKLDITKRKVTEEKIKHASLHDPLTGLPNRYYLDQYIESFITGSNQRDFAVLLLDFDRFKLINDTFGHYFGDVLLLQAIERLKTVISPECPIFRQGGDEFVILLSTGVKSEIEKTAMLIIDSFAEPFYIQNKQVYTSLSIGVSLYPTTGQEKLALIQQADNAMYMAKENGKNTFYFYNQQDEDFKYSLEMEMDLRHAIQHNQLELFYQPLIKLETGEIQGMEALLRWKHPYKGYIPPATFIPIAEESGLIVQLGEWVLREACKQNKQFQDKGLPSLTVAVNVSIRQINDIDFIPKITRILQETMLEPEFLEIEITESIMQNTNKTKHIINKLQEIGVKISIDDFGTGFSSLNLLKHLPLNTLKIDKSFVDDIGSSNEPLLKSIIELGINLHMDIVAEGVETEQQAFFLKKNNCHLGQGYLFSKPLPTEELEKLLKSKSEVD